MSSTFLDDVLTADVPIVRTKVAAGDAEGAFLGNGSIMMTTQLQDVMATASTTFEGEPMINFCRWLRAEGGPAALQTQALHLRNGVFTETYNLPAGIATLETFALRQHSSCAFQTLNLPGGEYTHAPAIPPNIIIDGGDHTYVSSKNVAVPCLRLNGYMRCDPHRRVSYLGAYVLADGIEWKGLDRLPEGAVNRFDVATSGVINVLHCIAVGVDCDAAVTRIAVAALTAANNNGASLRSAHTLRWASMWRAGITVAPRTPGDLQVAELNVAIKAALYRLISCRRDSGRVALAQSGTSWIKGANSVPALLPTLPDCAKALAMDVIKDANASVAANDPAAPRLDILTYAVLDVWNVFRTTLDRAWTRLAAPHVYTAANVILQRVEAAGLPSINPVTLTVPLTSAGIVSTALGNVVQDHGLTTHLVRQALSAATQIAYDLRDIPPTDWLTAYNQLVVPRDGATVRYSAADATNLRPDQTLMHHPYVFASPSPAVAPSAVLLAGLPAAQTAKTDLDPTLRLGASAVIATISPLVTGSINTTISEADQVVSNEITLMGPLWRGMGATPITDIEATSAFLCAIAFGFARARVYGVVDRDGVHVQRSRLETEPIALLPFAWAGITLTQTSAGAAPTVRSVSNSR